MAKRYVLFVADRDLSEAEKRELRVILERRHRGAKLIDLEGNPRAIILKTTNLVAPLFRSSEEKLEVGGKELKTVLTSGAVGNLKRRAAEGRANGQVHE